MPIMTARSTVGWVATAGTMNTCYPVNSFTLDPERAEAIPGQLYAGGAWPSPERPGGRWAEFAMQTDVPAATAATTHTLKPILEACGFKYTGSGPVFTLGDPHLQTGDAYAGSVKSADIEVDVDGDGATASSSWQTTVKTWVGGLEMVFEGGAMPVFNFAGRGLLDTTNVVTTPLLQATVADQWAASSITSLGTTARFFHGLISATNNIFSAANIRSFKFATNPRIADRRAVASALTGFLAPAIVGYAPSVELLVEVPAINSTTNPKPTFFIQTPATLAIGHQFSTGNTLTFQMTNAVVADLPAAEDVDGVLCQRAIIKPTASSAITLTWAYT